LAVWFSSSKPETEKVVAFLRNIDYNHTCTSKLARADPCYEHLGLWVHPGKGARCVVNFKEDMQEWMRTESCSCSSWAAGSSAMFFATTPVVRFCMAKLLYMGAIAGSVAFSFSSIM